MKKVDLESCIGFLFPSEDEVSTVLIRVEQKTGKAFFGDVCICPYDLKNVEGSIALWIYVYLVLDHLGYDVDLASVKLFYVPQFLQQKLPSKG